MHGWELAPAPLAVAAAALICYWQGFARLRSRRRELAGYGGAMLFTAGVLVGLLAVLSPLDRLGDDELLSAHMAQHMLLGDVAPLLVVLGLRGPIAFFAVPSALLKAIAGSRPLRSFLSLLLRPAVSFGAWIVVVYTWHEPALYDAAIAHPLLHDAEHATFFVVGALVWTQIVDPARRGRLGPGARAAFAGGILLAGMPLGEILIASGPLYPHYADVIDRPFGLTAGADQMRAGLVMMAEQVLTLVPAAAMLAWTHADRIAASPHERLAVE